MDLARRSEGTWEKVWSVPHATTVPSARNAAPFPLLSDSDTTPVRADGISVTSAGLSLPHTVTSPSEVTTPVALSLVLTSVTCLPVRLSGTVVCCALDSGPHAIR